MTYLAVALMSAAVGAWIDRWWANYLADDDDLRSCQRYDRYSKASQAIQPPRRWD